ncbi:MAG: 50S ribosomal protein L22 [Candidatus Saganbacteria bacterium]|nr:50S ribosomal protein L22 [Candidatus Saganbacteria bacterium]
MKVKAVSKYLRVSQRKVNRVLSLIRGKSVQDALTILKFLPHSGAKYAYETLKSAVANAKHNYKTDKESLKLAECYAGPSTPMKRFRAASRGRAHHILKRACHITMIVEAK